MIATNNLPSAGSAQIDKDFDKIRILDVSYPAVGGKEYSITPAQLGSAIDAYGGGEAGTNTPSGINLGAGASIYRETTAGSMQFKTLLPGAGINISADASAISFVASAMNLDLLSLDTEASPLSADYGVIYDSSASTHKKALLENWPINVMAGESGSDLDRDTDYVPFYDASASQNRHSLIADLIDTIFSASISVSGDILQSSSYDIYPGGAGKGISARVINPVSGQPATCHFRTGETTGAGNGVLASYAWAGSPFKIPDILTEFDQEGDYFRVADSGGTYKSFLYKDVPNAASSWQVKNMYGRFATGARTSIGLRIDDGTDDNYAEIYVTGRPANATQRVDFQSRGGSATAASTNEGALIIPAGQFITFRLLSNYSRGNYTILAYIMSENSQSVNIPGFNIVATSFLPAAGRAGIIIKNDTGFVGNPGNCDWFYNEL